MINWQFDHWNDSILWWFGSLKMSFFKKYIIQSFHASVQISKYVIVLMDKRSKSYLFCKWKRLEKSIIWSVAYFIVWSFEKSIFCPFDHLTTCSLDHLINLVLNHSIFRSIDHSNNWQCEHLLVLLYYHSKNR